MLSKNRIKRKYFQDNFAQSKKNRVKSKWLEKMNQLKKHILFFDFLENHYVSNDEVSKQHLSVIKKSNFVKANDKSTIRFIYIYIYKYVYGKKVIQHLPYQGPF